MYCNGRLINATAWMFEKVVLAKIATQYYS